MGVLAAILALVVIAATALSLVRVRSSWVRIWDFPRLQLAGLAVLALALGAPAWLRGWPWMALGGLLVVALAFQARVIWRYTRLAPVEVEPSRSTDPAWRISILECNVLQTNRAANLLLERVREEDPDLVLCVETDDWWQAQLDPLATTHPHAVRSPRSNTYGMLLYSRLPLEEVRVEHLVEADIPSIQAHVRLPGGGRVWLHCVHPRPPAPGHSEDSLPRDAELMIVGKRVRDSAEPVIVCGDLNDVAWSHSTRLFQKVSRLVDPRKGRGLFNTFHTRNPVFRVPLDHLFHSDCFRLVELRRLAGVGSDHFPIFVSLSCEPDAARRQEAPRDSPKDLQEARETTEEARDRGLKAQ